MNSIESLIRKLDVCGFYLTKEEREYYIEMYNNELNNNLVINQICECISVIGSFKKDEIYYCTSCKKKKPKQPKFV